MEGCFKFKAYHSVMRRVIQSNFFPLICTKEFVLTTRCSRSVRFYFAHAVGGTLRRNRPYVPAAQPLLFGYFFLNQ